MFYLHVVRKILIKRITFKCGFCADFRIFFRFSNKKKTFNKHLYINKSNQFNTYIRILMTINFSTSRQNINKNHSILTVRKISEY